MFPFEVWIISEKKPDGNYTCKGTEFSARAAELTADKLASQTTMTIRTEHFKLPEGGSKEVIDPESIVYIDRAA